MTTIRLSPSFSFWTRDVIDFDQVLGQFVWDPADQEVEIDLTSCQTANYQALALLVPYIWKLVAKGKKITVKRVAERGSPGEMWSLMGARGWSQVLFNEDQSFRGDPFKPLMAIRGTRDVGLALSRIDEYTKEFEISYRDILYYIVSELIYNTVEHGASFFTNRFKRTMRIPSLVQFTWYKTRDELSFLIADTGMGIKAHLEQAYPVFENDAEAIMYALQPRVSGTFNDATGYRATNNAGVGLFISSNIVRKLHADMYLLSGNGLVHVSPMDVTRKNLNYRWPGTAVLILVKLSRSTETLHFQRMMAELRDKAARESSVSGDADEDNKVYLSIENYFGKYAEDKQAAIQYRVRHLMPAIAEGKTVLLDFADVQGAPHSFLSALLAVPIQTLGQKAYKRLKIRNASTEIRETIDFILDENVTEGEE
ncbi:MAG: DUF4325 domain-containing protein [Magnetococcales bacterium]|nr:DUF4325 domain-containing protein [Magnetococcales bacterium]